MGYTECLRRIIPVSIVNPDTLECIQGIVFCRADQGGFHIPWSSQYFVEVKNCNGRRVGYNNVA